MPISEQTRKQVLAVLDRFSECYGKKDIDGVLALFDLHIRGFGTGADETVIGREQYRQQLEREFAEAEKISLEFSDIRMSGEGTIVWLMGGMAVEATVDGKSLRMPMRMTCVLRGTGHAWIIAQMHFSLPAAGQEPGRSFTGSA